VIPTFNNLIGSPALNLVQEVVKPILQIVSIASKQIVDQQLVHASFLENKITEQLCKTMIAVKNRLNKRLRIEEEVGTFHTTETGRIDFKIIYDIDERNYFGIECKRLSGKRKERLDREYVTKGMMRFITGKYSYSHQWGMMVGYVISGTCKRVIQLVRERIDEYKKPLRIENEFAGETRFGRYPFLYSSHHQQEVTNTLITLLHYFFEVQS